MAIQGGLRVSSLNELLDAFDLKANKEGQTGNLHRRAVSILKESKAGRTNQFATFDQYHGLVEKAEVYNHGELADCMLSAWRRLSARQSKWTPEVLSFLLHLSDDPINKTSIDRLASSTPTTASPSLTWETILKDDPYDDADIWDNVDFAEASSEDLSELSLDDVSPDLPPSSPEPEETVAQDYMSKLLAKVQLPADFEHVGALKAARSALSEDTFSFSESRVIRETIFMLLGLPSDAYTRTAEGKVAFNSKVTMVDVSSSILHSTLSHLAAIGTDTSLTRKWVDAQEDVHFVQAFQASVGKRLESIDHSLFSIQHRMARTEEPPVTILSLTREVQSLFQHILPITKIVQDYVRSEKAKPFVILQSLFETVCDQQSIGDYDSCKYIAGVFADCLKTYSISLRSWMTIGKVDIKGSIFFVKENPSAQPLAKLWSDKHSLIHDDKGHLQAPRFLHLSTKRIFATGKSVSFLKALGRDDSDLEQEAPDLSVTDVTEIIESQWLLPFEETFRYTFDLWVSSMHRSSSEKLRMVLGSKCGLWQTIDSLELIYFGSQGSVSDQAVQGVFEPLDRGRYNSWNGLMLTGLFRDAFNEVPFIDASRISVRLAKERNKQSDPRAMHQLERIEIGYALHWTIANIIKPDSIVIYQRTFTVLLQFQRAKHVLDKQTLKEANFQATNSRLGLLLSFLRHRLRWFIVTFQAYFAFMLPASLRASRQDMEVADDIDEMIDAHSLFVQRLETRCLTSNQQSSILQAMVSILDLTTVFVDTCSSSNLQHDDEALISRFENMVGTFNRLLSFVFAGIREASRVGGDDFLQMLADDVAYGLKAVDRDW